MRVVAEEAFFVRLGEGAAGGEEAGAGEGVRVRGLDAADEVAVVRGGAEGRDLLAADGEEDALGGGAEGLCGARHVGDAGPAVAGLGFPWRTGKDEERGAGLAGGLGGVGGDAAGEGVGGVDEDVDAFGREPAREAFGAAEAAGADIARLRDGIAGAAGEREGHAGVGARGEAGGELARLGGAAQDQDMPVAHAVI